MWTVVRGGEALSDRWESGPEPAWVPFRDLVREAGTDRSFARFPSEEAAKGAAAPLGGRAAEVLVERGGEKFEIVLQRPPRRVRA